MYYRGFREMTTKHVMEIAKKAGGITAIWPKIPKYELTAQSSDGSKKFSLVFSQVDFQQIPQPGMRADIILNVGDKRYKTRALMFFFDMIGENIKSGDKLPIVFNRGGGGGQIIYENVSPQFILDSTTALIASEDAYNTYNNITTRQYRIYSEIWFDNDINEAVNNPTKSVFMPLITATIPGIDDYTNFADYDDNTDEYTLRPKTT